MSINGTQTKLSITDPKDEAGAWVEFKALLAQAVAENAAAGPKPIGARPDPLSALVPAYLDSISHRVDRRTVRCYGYSLKAFAARFPKCAAGDVDPVEVEKDATGRGWSDSHRANYLWTVQAFVRWCGRKDFTLHRPAKDSRGAEVLIDAETYRIILRETRGDFHEFCRLLWCVGCRPSEAARLTAEGIDWTHGTMTFRGHKTRHKGQRRILYFSTDALAILAAQKAVHPTGPLFRGQRNQEFTIHAVVCRLLRLSARAGIKVTSYAFRHTWATRALEQGIPDTHVAALMGHSSTAMVHRHYSHCSENGKLLSELANKVA